MPAYYTLNNCFTSSDALFYKNKVGYLATQYDAVSFQLIV